jgi:uncharacterized protein DUF4328
MRIAAPEAVGYAPMSDDLSHGRRVERRLARWTACFLLVFLALDAGGIACRMSERAMFVRMAAGAPPAPQEAAMHDARLRGVEQLTLAAFAGTAVLWLAWLRLAYGNLALVGSKRSRFTRGGVLAYWFIPVVNLVRPFQIMKDLWLRSESMNDRDAYDQLPAPAFLSAWWGLFLARGGLAMAVTSLVRQAGTPADLIDVTDLGIVVNLVGAVGVLLAIALVWGIHRRQQCFEATLPDLPTAVQRAAHTPRLHA